jgi:ferrous iron transport protein B
MSAAPPVVLVGNPNVGKSALFGALTGAYATVSNYPGTTVELTEGTVRIAGRPLTLVDTPGVASLHPASEDERVTRDLLISRPPAAAVVVADAKNLERALVLVLELGELGIPLVLCLNMVDEAAEDGLSIDHAALSEALGVPVVPTVAVRRHGVGDLCASITEARVPDSRIAADDPAEQAEQGTGAPHDYAEARARQRTAWALAARVRRETKARPESRVRTLLERATMHPVWGWPLLLAVLYATYLFVGVFGAGTLVDLLEDGLFGSLVNPLVVRAANRLPWAALRDLLVGPYGVVTMALTYALALVLPIVTTFFIAFGALEDSGYLPRLAVMLNRAFRAMGLSGKAVLPMVLGLGCDTMATLTTRVLETPRERLIVILLLALGVPCSAQLAVVLGLLGPLPGPALVVWLAVVLLSLFGVGRLAAAVIPGSRSDFILELPPLRRPRLGNMLVKTLGRVEWYLKEAVPLFVLGTLILFAADRLHVLRYVEQAGRPVVTGLLGLPPEASQAFVIGFLRRDFGAAGLFRLAETGALDTSQVLVAAVTITLFIPCIAHLFMIVRERGLRTALAVAAFVIPFAVAMGALVRVALRAFPGVLR